MVDNENPVHCGHCCVAAPVLVGAIRTRIKNHFPDGGGILLNVLNAFTINCFENQPVHRFHFSNTALTSRENKEEGAMSFGKSVKVLALVLVALMLLTTGQSTPVSAEEKPFRSDVITQVAIGDIKAGKYVMKATITTIQPRAKIPFHIHQYNGLRYMLDGSLSISWKDGGFQTYSAGSTYFEGPGANHPQTDMAASNPTDSVTKVLIIELVPLD